MPIIYVYYYRSAVMLVVFSHAAFGIPIYIPIRCSHARSSHAAFCTLQCVKYYNIILSAAMLVRFFRMLHFTCNPFYDCTFTVCLIIMIF